MGLCGPLLAALLIFMWAPCLNKALCAAPGPAYAKDRKNRIYKISPAGVCCENNYEC